MQRFWDQACLEPVDGGFTILLDGRPMRLPGRAKGVALLLPGPALAAAVAAEWQAAGGQRDGRFEMTALPLTRLAATAQDRIAPDPGPVIDALAAYAEDDLLCYRALAPPPLAARQAEAWQPWLDWAAATFEARLLTTAGIVHIDQPAAALAALRRALARHDPAILAGLGVAVPATGSLVLGLALAAGALPAADAHRLGQLDASFQAEFWGEDEEAALRASAIGQDVEEAALFMALARADGAS